MWRPHSSEARLAAALSQRLAGHRPTTVVGIARGGARLSALVAEQLGVPCATIDIAYPASRPWLGALGEATLFVFKELLYRLSSPRLRGSLPAFEPHAKLALIDDTASSGRTLTAALSVLLRAGVPRERIVVAVGRCGPRARRLVDVTGDSPGTSRIPGER